MSSLTWVLVGLFAFMCLVLTGFMPWAELGLPADGPLGSLREPFLSAFAHVQGKQGSEYYVYATMLGLALIAAAIAINVVGRLDAEEKTILPLKK
jgi:hypothetical protein